MKIKNINPTIYCNKKNLKKFLTFKKKPPLEIDFGISKEEYLRYYYKCSICGHMLAKHKDFFSNEMYKNKYFKSNYQNKKNLSLIFKKIINLPKSKSDNYYRVLRVKKVIKKYLKNNNYKLLDVGSGTGVFPYKIQTKNSKIHAIDPSRDCTNFLKKKSNAKIKTITGDFLKIKKKKLSIYDVITFNKVLEHVDEPALFLVKAKKLLKKKNIIYIEVPHTDALNNKKEGKYREEFGLGHNHVFTKKSLRNILKLTGFSILEIKSLREPSGKYTLYAFGQYR